jgi:hypothetical protein
LVPRVEQELADGDQHAVAGGASENQMKVV